MTETTAYTCEICEQTSPREEWRLTEVPCEDCGTHYALQCPRCLDTIDLVYAKGDYPDAMGVKEGFLQ